MLMTSLSSVGVFIGILLGAVGGAVALAQFARGNFTARKQRQRREDAVWGYVDDQGIRHEGVVDEFRRHIADRSIHCYDHQKQSTAGP